ncbi:MAG TPA: putative metal-binding motif-containing protein [Nitrospirota bacterium]
MKKLTLAIAAAAIALPLMVSSAFAFNSYLNSVNSKCGTTYNCGLCHVDTGGGGPLTADGNGFMNSGNDSCYFCPEVCNPPACTDADGDGYFAEATCGTSVDCDDSDPSVNAGALEVCDDGIDNDCDGMVDCADRQCGVSPACAPAVTPENCSDGIDNDGDGKVDCADGDCRKDPNCSVTHGGGREGKGKTCKDGIDNDGDGLVDCADSDCAGNRACK